MKKRKLISPKLTSTIQSRMDLGVPLTTIRKQLELDISYPALQKLLEVIKKLNDSTVASVYPEWLEQDSLTIQEQPDNYKYVGYFPYGEWIRTDGFN